MYTEIHACGVFPYHYDTVEKITHSDAPAWRPYPKPPGAPGWSRPQPLQASSMAPGGSDVEAPEILLPTGIQASGHLISSHFTSIQPF